MTWRSFRSFCRKNAKRVPYHPEAFLQDAPAKPPQPIYYRVAALAGTAAVLVVAFAAVLLSNLFQPAPGPGFADSSASHDAFPAGVDPAELYTYLAELSYTDEVQPFETERMTAAEQLQYANQVYLQKHGQPLYKSSQVSDANVVTLSLSAAQALLDRLFGPNAQKLAEQDDIGSLLSWFDGTITTLYAGHPIAGEDRITLFTSTEKSPDSDRVKEKLLALPLFYYIEDLSVSGSTITVKTAAFAGDVWTYPTDSTEYQRLQAQLKSWSRTRKADKQAIYTFGIENGVPYLLSCRDADSSSSTSPTGQLQPNPTSPPVTEPVWTNPTSDPPSLLDKVRWTGQSDPDALLPLFHAFSLRGGYKPPESPEDKQTAADYLLVLSGAFRGRVEDVKKEWDVRWDKMDDDPETFKRLQIPFESAVSMPFDSLNLMAEYYFAGLSYERKDLLKTYNEELFTAILYDAETDRAYLVCPPTGLEPDIYVIAGEEVEGSLVHYTLLRASKYEDEYSSFYDSYGFAAVQRCLLDSYPFSSTYTSVMRMTVDMQTGRPRVVSLTLEDESAGENLESLLEGARAFVEVEPGDPAATSEMGDARLLSGMNAQIKGMSVFFTPEGSGGREPEIRYQDLMACATEEVIRDLETGGYLTSVDGKAVAQPISDLYQNDWGRGRVLSASRTDRDDIFQVLYTAPDLRYSKNRRFSFLMKQNADGVFLVASLPQEIP